MLHIHYIAKKKLRSASSNEVYQLTMLYKVWRCQGRILMLLPLRKTLTDTCLNSFRVHFLSFYKGWASSEYSFLVSSEKQALWIKFLRKKDVPDYLCICSLWDTNNVVTFIQKCHATFIQLFEKDLCVSSFVCMAYHRGIYKGNQVRKCEISLLTKCPHISI